MVIADMGYDFSNKLVLITGGTGALGRAVVEAFSASKAASVTTYISDREGESAMGKVKTVDLIKADITKEGQVIKLVSDIIQ
ncbi:MAG: SDR family NAD(P)-dependent oxidoreductase, partial [Nitrososphaera sp.]